MLVRWAPPALTPHPNPPGFYLDAYTDAEDAFAVLDLVSDWLVDFSLLNTGLHLHVIPLPHKAAAPHA